MITAESTIEEIIVEVPDAVTYLMRKGIRCLVCGEPPWGTLKDAALEKGFTMSEIEQFVNDLRKLQEENPVRSTRATKE
jgi:hypothetical protein